MKPPVWIRSGIRNSFSLTREAGFRRWVWVSEPDKDDDTLNDCHSCVSTGGSYVSQVLDILASNCLRFGEVSVMVWAVGFLGRGRLNDKRTRFKACAGGFN